MGFILTCALLVVLFIVIPNKEQEYIKGTKGKLRKHPRNRKGVLGHTLLENTWQYPEYKIEVSNQDRDKLNSGKANRVEAELVFSEDGDYLDDGWIMPVKKGDRYLVWLKAVNPDMNEYLTSFRTGTIKEQYLENKYNKVKES